MSSHMGQPKKRKKVYPIIIHVNRQFIQQNQKDGKNRPVYIVRQGQKVRYARSIVVTGALRFVPYGEQLPCGARAWAEALPGTKVDLIDEMSFKEARDV